MYPHASANTQTTVIVVVVVVVINATPLKQKPKNLIQSSLGLIQSDPTPQALTRERNRKVKFKARYISNCGGSRVKPTLQTHHTDFAWLHLEYNY